MELIFYAKTKSAHHKIRSCGSLAERYKVVLASGNPMAAPMIDFNTLEVFYYPRIGKYIFQSLDGESLRYKNSGHAAAKAKDIASDMEKDC